MSSSLQNTNYQLAQGGIQNLNRLKTIKDTELKVKMS